MSHLLIVDAHLGVAARLRYLDKGTELLPPSRSSSRPGCRQVRSTSGGSTGDLRITVVANLQVKGLIHICVCCTALPSSGAQYSPLEEKNISNGCKSKSAYSFKDRFASAI